MRRQLIALTIAAQLASAGWAQTAREEIRNNIHLTASNTLAYPGPKQKLTPAPKGKKPFYISHYGRHGSRFLTNRRDYYYPYEAMMRADTIGKLTPLGREVMERVKRILDEAEGRTGELTPLGAQQLRQIAARMYQRFPEVFKGDAYIDARSTTVLRCVLSMENALQQLLILNPKLRINHDASKADMGYMNMQDRHLVAIRNTPSVQTAFDKFKNRVPPTDRLVRTLFNDTLYIKRHVNAERLTYSLFKLASNVQSTELRRQLTLYDIFTDDELYNQWETDNAYWYIWFGPSPLNGSTQPYSQRRLLRTMIEEADSCLKLHSPGASLRFGHETIVMPLTCLLELNDYGQQIDDLAKVAKHGWRNYRIFPMGCNLQIVFYRSGPADHDILLKVLLNEDEMSLPLKTNQWPYYSWSDFRQYYLNKLDAYEEAPQ